MRKIIFKIDCTDTDCGNCFLAVTGGGGSVISRRNDELPFYCYNRGPLPAPGKRRDDCKDNEIVRE